MTIHHAVLQSEIDNDPAGRGYKTGGVYRDDVEIARLCNDVVAGQTVERTLVDVRLLQEQVVATEYLALSVGQQNLWTALIAAGERVDIRNANIRAQGAAVWGAGTTTRANIVALQSKPASRAEVLFGEGAAVTHTDVAIALGRS